jgi:uncharacterized phage protein (TIGR02220 family)
MARYRKIDTRTWNDKKFNELSDSGKLVFFLLLTHPHMTSIDAMRASLPSLGGDLHWSFGKIEHAFQEILQKNIAKYDESASFIWLPNFLKYNHPESPNVIKSWNNSLDYLPECNLKTLLIEHLKFYVSTLSSPFQGAFSLILRKTMPNQEQEHEQEQEQDKNTFPKHRNNLPFSKLRLQAIDVLNFLNEKTGKRFRPVDTNLKMIITRLKTGATVMECRQIIAMKYREWSKNPDMVKYVRPETLFGTKKFESYLGELVIPNNADCDHEE